MHVFDNSTPLEALLAAASVGVEAACSEFYRRYNCLVCSITLRCLWRKGCNTTDHSEDIIAASWFAILTHLNQVKENDKIERWIAKIVLRQVFAHVSGHKGCIRDQLTRLPPDALEQACIVHADKICENGVLANEIRARAKKISPKFAEVMRLYIEEDYTMEEIATKLNESPAKVRSMFYRALSALRKFFRDNSWR